MQLDSIPPSSHLTPRRLWAAVGVLTTLAGVLRGWDLAQESYWLDELSAIRVAQPTWMELVHQLRVFDVHPPLYFALLKVWGAAFGFGEVAARALSVTLGLIAIPSGAALAGVLAERLGYAPRARARAVLLVAALLAASPFATYYAREARGYSLLLGLAMLSTWLLLRAVPACRPRALLAYAIVTAALAYTHVFGVFTALAHGLYALTLLATGALPRRQAWKLLAAQAFAALAFLPWLPVALAQIRRVSGGFWVPTPTPGQWLRTWMAEGALSVLWVTGVVVLAVLGMREFILRRRAGWDGVALVVVVLASLLLPTVVPLALSFVRQPIFVAKYAIGAGGLVLVLAGLALARLEARGAVVIFCALPLVGVLEAGRDVFLWRHKEDWRALTTFASRQALGPHVPLAHAGPYSDYLRHYLEPGSVLWTLERADLVEGRPGCLAERLANAGQDRFWMLNIHPATGSPEFSRLLRRRYRPARVENFFMATAVLWVDATAPARHTSSPPP